ncbi:hypothetical protein I546_0130 [Mycobacterium kansasii 732]|nr:hypothetical protein I546_0130 [Mycobacterium kansasii 732]
MRPTLSRASNQNTPDRCAEIVDSAGKFENGPRCRRSR